MQKNHLIGLKRKYLKLLFENEQELMKVRRVVMADVKRNKENAQSSAIYSEDIRLKYAGISVIPIALLLLIV